MNEVLRSLHALRRGALPMGRVHSRIVFRLAAVVLCLIAESVFAATLTVTNRNDSGPGSLRQAIADANPAGGDAIQFAVAGAINLESGLSTPAWPSIPGLADLTPQTNGNAQLTHFGGLSIDHSYYRVRLLP